MELELLEGREEEEASRKILLANKELELEEEELVHPGSQTDLLSKALETAMNEVS